MNCLIVDDNAMAQTAMIQLVSQVDDLTVVAECANAMEAYNQTMMYVYPVISTRAMSYS